MEQIERTSLALCTNVQLHEYLTNLGTAGYDPYLRQQFNNTTLLVDYLFTTKNIAAIYVFDMSGSYIGTDIKPKISEYKNYIPIALKKDGLIEWVVENGQDETMLVLRAIYNANVEPIGMLVMETRLNSIRTLATSKLSDIEGKLIITDENNRIVSSDDHQMAGMELLPGKTKKVSRSLKNYDIYEMNGKPHLIHKYQSVYNNWSYICVIPLSTITSNESAIIWDLVFIAVICTLIAGIFTYIIARSITEPLLMLTAKLRNVDIDIKDKIDYSSQDEFSYLYNAYNAMQDRIHNLINQAYEEQLLRNEMEIKALQMQISPHFIYNTLEIINCIAIERKVYEINEIVLSFTAMLRYCLTFDSTDSMMSTLGNEVSHVINYCNIQKLHYGSNVNYFFDVTSDLEQIKIPRLSLQPIVENAFVHGIRRQKPDEIGFIELTSVRDGEGVRIRIKNSGPPISEEDIHEIIRKSENIKFGQTHGIGIANVVARINIFFGDAGDCYGVKIYKDENNYTTFELFVPF